MTTEQTSGETRRGIKGPWVVGGFFAAVAVMAWIAFHPPMQKDTTRLVAVPDLTPRAANGQAVFNRVCADCHGQNASGGTKGPSLVHAVYWPAHHADGAFRLAVERGVRAHHWGFGDMPAQKDKVSAPEIEDIIVFVRALQKANPKENQAGG